MDSTKESGGNKSTVSELVKTFNETFLNLPKSSDNDSVVCATESTSEISRNTEKCDNNHFSGVTPTNYHGSDPTDFDYEQEFEDTVSRLSTDSRNLNSSQYKELQRSIEKLDERDRNAETAKADFIDDELDRRSLSSLKGATFPEAYNHLGNELCITTIGSVEHLEITQPSDLHETKVNRSFHFEDYYEPNSQPYLEKAGPSSVSSNRSTVYSDEGIESDVDAAQRETKRPMKTETFYDQYQNPIIEIVRKLSNSDLSGETTHAVDSSRVSKKKQDYIIEEIIETEKSYLLNLKRVVDDYIPYVQSEQHTPSNLIDKSHIIFGNIEDIYRESLNFCEKLGNSNRDSEEIAQCFTEFEHLFSLYPLYTKNKLLADSYFFSYFKEIVQERDNQLNDRLGLSSYLLTPIQRLGKYILFLNQLQKENRKCEKSSKLIGKAIEIVQTQMSRGNDFVAIESILECPINLSDKGSLILRSSFTVFKPKRYDTVLFLFEEVLVFTVPDNKNSERFIYKDHTNLNEMGILNFEEQELVFYIKRFSSYKQGEYDEIGLEAKSTKDKKIWTEEIEKRLWEQLRKCKEEQRKQSRRRRNSLDLDSSQQVRRRKSKEKRKSSEMKKSTFYL